MAYPMTEYVDVHTAAGTFTIDISASEDNGLIDTCETGGGAMEEVSKASSAGNHLIDKDGHAVLIERDAILARTYRRAE